MIRKLAFLPLGVLILVGCADDGAPAQDELVDGGARDPTALEGEERVEVTLDEFEIEMPDTVSAGFIVFEATNRGTHEHSLEVEGPGVHHELPDPINPGNTMELTVELRPGTYRFYCPVEDHSQRGMEKSVVVQ